MFIDWPKQKAQLELEISAALRARMRVHAPVAALFPRITVEEGDGVVLVDSTGGSRRIEMNDLEASAAIEGARFRTEGASVLPDLIDQVAKQAAKSMETDMFETLRNAPPSAGGMFTAANADEVAEEMVEALEKMDLGFDPAGNPTSFLAMHPTTWARISGDVERLNQSVEMKRRFDAIIERKRNEWHRNEGHRRLAD